jgi:predicted RNase H-like HicB family nuclease
MRRSTATTAEAGKTTYTYSVVVEPDEDAWHAYCPALQGYGAATWGTTRAEALRHIREVVKMVVAELIEDGETLPADEAGSAGASTRRTASLENLPDPVRKRKIWTLVNSGLTWARGHVKVPAKSSAYRHATGVRGNEDVPCA